MLIRFHGENTGSIMMFESAAHELLKLMDTSGAPKGALMAEDVPHALSCLEQALEALRDSEADAVRVNEAQAEQAAEEGREVAEVGPGLLVRAAPLLELLREAVKTRSYFMWEPA
ncbi:DUF1840 domain-containing protein [Plasticicumulans acidivorans]|uniref:Uncharacterized protein DUF1840 n=1 Tax=Plasticicumulans acidivorans TaxID=886464 RepID=A0A317N0G6_9GAMM|nr:DUF1840 domain-containing protein [Plasticicumulans acidivorans]PWV65985.1 uncharacterized protein DUF1840 [Plasticicumulans acidivorans]